MLLFVEKNSKAKGISNIYHSISTFLDDLDMKLFNIFKQRNTER